MNDQTRGIRNTKRPGYEQGRKVGARVSSERSRFEVTTPEVTYYNALSAIALVSVERERAKILLVQVHPLVHSLVRPFSFHKAGAEVFNSGSVRSRQLQQCKCSVYNDHNVYA